MIVKEPYWFFKKIIPDHLCDNIVKYAYEQFTAEIALTSWNDENLKNKILKGDPEALKKQHEIRKSSIVWLDEAWIFNLIKPPIWIANKNAGWNFNYFAFERFQFTIYKENGYYDWHQDIVNDASDERKISASLFLNDSDDYEEGEFQFKYQDGRNKGDTKITTLDRSLCKKGSLLVFPSYLFHRVKPVKKGMRNSLVIWSRGPKFQ